MLQLCQAPKAALYSLRHRATGRCLQFSNQELPPGSVPARGRVGLEVDPAEGLATLYVEKGVRYYGVDPLVRQWLEHGHLQFDTFEDLCRWIQQDLLQAYQTPMAEKLVPIPGLQAGWSRPFSLPLVGREALLEEIECALVRQIEPAGVLLVGSSGVGRTAICCEFSKRWETKAAQNVAFRVDLPVLLAGATYPTERNQRLQQVYDQVLAFGASGLLVLENLELVCAALTPFAMTPMVRGKRPGVDPFAQLALREAIESGLQLVATVQPSSAKWFRTAFERRLEVIEIPEPTPGQLLESILPAVATRLEERLGIEISTEALNVSVRQSHSDPGAQPAKAVRLLERAALRAARRNLEILGPDDMLD